MNKKLFYLLIFLMSLSLIGIIFVQGFWISESVKAKREQFAFNAKQALLATTTKIQNQEFEERFLPYQTMIDSLGIPDDLSFDEYLLVEEDPVTNEIFLFRNGILQQDVRLAAPGLDTELDSISYTRFFNRKITQILDKSDGINEEINGPRTAERLREFARLNEFERYAFQAAVAERVKRIPIHKRINEETIKNLLTMELVERDLETDFEFGVYNNDLATKVVSDDFELNAAILTYGMPLFLDANGISDFDLYVNFPSEKKFVYSSIVGMVSMSVIFTLIIIIAYTNALSQLNKQRQISQIKTDFINNMTHEFKTPIATINLALDAIKNPKISGNPEKVAYYQGMIREENRRMHAQVENVLRISKLEKNELDIKKESLDLHDIIQDAVQHVELIVEDRQGYVKMHLDAQRTGILANESHFTNVIVNMLDNAVKYSSEIPEIDVFTENVKEFVIVKVQDKGDGMSKAVAKKVFEKFYREHTGNIHNVKGHGLGLSYVKQIVDDHHGEIYVESEKGKGSTFIIKLPLIS